MMEYHICSIQGDGIGPEIVKQAQKVLHKLGEIRGIRFHFHEALLGGSCIDAYGVPLADETLEIASRTSAILMGSIGGRVGVDSWYELPPHLRPEAGLLALRKSLDLYGNIRPAKLYPFLSESSPLSHKVIKEGFDVVIVRELTSGIYFGERDRLLDEKGRYAYDTMYYHEAEIRRIAHLGFKIAKRRKKKLSSIDKSNVLDSSRLWREVVMEVAKEYPEVSLEHILVDNAAMQLVKNPTEFDVILANNMFGDILSDEASMLTGSIGLLPSASVNETSFGLYEPIHGSAPEIAGKNIANPIATILSAAMLLTYSLHLQEEGLLIEKAVEAVLGDDYRTADIMFEGGKALTCSQMGDMICRYLERLV